MKTRPTDIGPIAGSILRRPRDLVTQLGRNRTGRAVSGLSVDYLGFGVTQVLSFVITPILVTSLSVPIYGLWVVITQVLFWLNLLDGGASIYLVKFISGEKDGISPRLTHVIGTTFWTYVFLGFLTVTVGFAIAPLLPGWASIEQAEIPAAILAFQIAVITAAITLVVTPTFQAILLAHQQIASANLINYCVNTINLLLTLGLVLAGFGIVSMSIAQLCATLLGAVVSFALARRYCHFSLSPRHFRTSEVRAIVRFSLFFQMNKLSFLANTFSDAILIAGSLGAAAVPTYTLTQKLPMTTSFVVTKPNGVLLPGMAELFAQNDIERLQQVVLRLVRLFARISILGFILTVTLNQRFVTLWVGPALYGGMLLTLLFAYMILYNGIIGSLSVLFFSSGQLEGWGTWSVVSAIVKIGLTLILLPWLGLLAPIIGTIVGGLFPGTYALVKTSHLIQLRIGHITRVGVLPPLIRSLPTVLVLVALSAVVPISWNWIGLVCIGLGGLLANMLTFDSKQILATWYK